MADLDGDGRNELIVAVSYYFDEDFYSVDDHRLPGEVDMDKYLAGK